MNITDLDDDCLSKILSLIPLTDLIKVKLVNHQFLDITDELHYLTQVEELSSEDMSID